MTRLLLHACCAPCSLEPVRLLLEEGFEPTICWTNPNIQPTDEHDRRLAELRRWCAAEGIPLIEAAEDTARWEARVAPIGALRREMRCRACYALRLAEACRVAVDEGFTHIATTLAVSPYQLFDTCNDVLERLARAHGLIPVVRDFARARDVPSELLRMPLLGSRGRARPRPPARRAPRPSHR